MIPIAGIDLGGTRIKGAIFDGESGDLLAKQTVPTRDGDREDEGPAFVAQAKRLLNALEENIGVVARLVGVSSPGLANREATAIDFMPGRLAGLEGLNWAETLQRPGTTVLNDAHAALMGEIWQGSARGLRDVVFLTLGTGVGGAAVSEGRLIRGHLGRAGHLGHLALDFHGPGDICGTPGSLEDLVGNHSIATRSKGRFESTRELVDALTTGDSEATAIWNESMRALAAGIASLINVFDPEAVLIGGGISEAWEAIEAPLSRWLDEFEWRPGGFKVEIRRATLGEWAGVYGAAFLAAESETRRNS